MRASKAEEYMRRAVELSRSGYPAPNPHVGCVIVKDGEVVGEGFHDHAGGPHAEIVALNQAGLKAKGAEVYVTLEPCNHQGRTGPCSVALIEAGVGSVSYAVSDPNPRAEGGAARLSEAGVKVVSGLLEEEARAANIVFLTAMKLGRPFVTVKAAISLDGKIALPNGESKWITGPEARTEGQKLRAEMGAVLVGANTIVRDDPELTARIEGVVNQPVRVILDAANIVPDSERALQSGEVIHFVGQEPREGHKTQRTRRNTQDKIFLEAPEDRFDLDKVLRHLWDRKVTSLLVEGGALTIGSFLEACLFERLELFVAPIVIGQGITWSGAFSIPQLSDALRLEPKGRQVLGGDLWLRFERIG